MPQIIKMSNSIAAGGGNTTLLVDKTSSTNVYIGVAVFGSATSSSVWQIFRVNTAAGIVSIQYADGNDKFDNEWDDRATLTYQN